MAEAEKHSGEKRVSKKLCVPLIRFSGVSIAETAKRMNGSERKAPRLIAEYKTNGLEELMRCKYTGNHRRQTKEEENEILSQLEEMALQGHVVTAQDIKKAFDKRHGWRKVTPRARHPRKAGEEAIEASKKLTVQSVN